MSNTINKPGEDAASVASSVARSADQAIHATQRAVKQGMQELSAQAGDARDQAGNAFQHLVSDAGSLAHRGMDAVHEGADQMRAKSQHMKEATVGYIQHEPVKSMLMSAAVGAALMGLVVLLGRHGGNSR